MHLHCIGEYVHLGNKELHQPLLFRREQFIPNRVEPLQGFRYVPFLNFRTGFLACPPRFDHHLRRTQHHAHLLDHHRFDLPGGDAANETGVIAALGRRLAQVVSVTLSRERILSSSNGGAAVDWPAGSVVALFCVAPAEVIQRGVRSGVTVTTPGMLRVQPGVARWYPPMAVTFTTWEAWVGQAPGGIAAQFTLRRNGLAVATGSIAAGSQRMSHEAISLSLTPDDWLTLEVTQTGVSPPGSDLTVRLIP
ncbi:MAG: hypothetical protein HQL63_14600 [Magnetococcales bacterium]|nr:hypothetical protein [Magnetococcales bacterium]